jgi:hypothetical protein
MRAATRLFAIAILAGFAGVAALAQATNPLVGTWKLNAAKSKGTTFTSGTTKVEAVGQGVKFTVELADASGAKSSWSFTANYDGKDYPVTGSSPYGDTASLTRVDAQTTRVSVKMGGKPTVTQTIVVAADGKSRTTTTKGTGPNGQAVDAVSFYERQ